MGAIASQITSLAIVYSLVYSDAEHRKHQSSASLAFVRGIHRGPVNSPHKWSVTRKMFHLMTPSWKSLIDMAWLPAAKKLRIIPASGLHQVWLTQAGLGDWIPSWVCQWFAITPRQIYIFGQLQLATINPIFEALAYSEPYDIFIFVSNFTVGSIDKSL